MGANISTQINENVQKIVSDTLNEQSSNTDNSLDCLADQTQVLNIGGKDATISLTNKCKMSIKQESHVKLDCMIKATKETNMKQSSEAIDKLKNLAKQKLEQENEGVNFGQLNISTAISKSDQYIEKNVKNIMNSVVNNALKVDVNASNVINLDFKNFDCDGAEIDISQSGVIKNIAKVVSKELITGWQKAVGITTIVNETEQEAVQKNEGLSGLAIFGIVFVVLIILIIMAYLYSKMSSGSAGSAANISRPNYTAPLPIEVD